MTSDGILTADLKSEKKKAGKKCAEVLDSEIIDGLFSTFSTIYSEYALQKATSAKL